jgi:hypothetical protein
MPISSPFSADPNDVLGTLLGGAGLGYAALNVNRPLPGMGQLTSVGQNLMGTGNTLMQQGLTGALPSAFQSQIDQATRAKEAAMRQQMGNMGLANSTMAVQAENALRDQASALEGQLSLGLLKSGIAATGVGADLVMDAVKIYGSELNDLQKAMANFSRALAGGGQQTETV